jgi:hypothetical protein
MKMPRSQRKVRLPVAAPHRLPLAERLPGSRAPFWRRLHVNPGSTYRVAPLCDSVVTCYCHFHKGNYVPCYRDEGDPCLYCVPDGPRRAWQGSLVVREPNDPAPRLLNLTGGAMEGCPELFSSGALYGRELVVTRRPGPRNAPMCVTISGRRYFGYVAEKVIAASEVWKVQLNVWGVELVPLPREE